MEYYSAIKKNTFESVLMRWMKLEPFIQSEVSQEEKYQYSILTHIYGIYKDGNDNSVCETAKETQMYRTVFWTLWERARVGCLGECHWNMYNIIYEMNCQSRFDAWYRMLWASALGWPRGMVREGGRRGFRMGNTCIPVVDSCWCMAKPIQYCKVINLLLK